MKVIKDTPFEFGHLVWQVRPPRPSLTVVVKGTFTLVPDAPCEIAEEQALVTGETFWEDDPTQSVRLDTDLAVLKTRAECFLAGTCHPPERPATISAVSFRVGSVVKRLAVFGDRHWERGISAGLPSPALPFMSMPLSYERSFGGEGYESNPIGRGLDERLPNIEDPSDLVTSPSSRPRPAGAFPIPRHWKSRTRLAGTYDDAWLKTRWPWFPEDFDPAHFNAAPDDQRIDGYWRGDEELELVNLHPEHPVLRSRLPGFRARCFLVTSADPFREVPLRLDTISVDADAGLVYCVWRGLAEVESEKLTDIQEVFLLDEPIAQPGSVEACRTRYDAKLREEAEEAQQAQPEAPTTPPDGGPGIEAELMAAGIVAAEAPDVPPLPGEAEPSEAVPEAPPPSPELRERVEQRLAAGESLDGEDLSGVDLTGMSLTGADFTNAILKDARLERAQFDGAKLEGAVLEGAHADGASFRGASLQGADLTGLIGADVVFDGADLQNSLLLDARLERAHFAEADLSRADLTGAELKEADFSKAKLDGANLSDAKVVKACFTEGSLVDTTLEGADASGAVFDGANLETLRASEGASFVGASLKQTRAAGSRWGTSRLDGANLSFSILDRADFNQASLVGTVFAGCELKKATFVEAVLVGASMVKANVAEGDFESADLTDADLRGANLFGAEFWKASLERTRLELANVKRTKLKSA